MIILADSCDRNWVSAKQKLKEADESLKDVGFSFSKFATGNVRDQDVLEKMTQQMIDELVEEISKVDTSDLTARDGTSLDCFTFSLSSVLCSQS